METARTYTRTRLLILAAMVAIVPLAFSQPLKVRGGAMTFSTDPDNGDKFSPSTTTSNTYCVFLGPAGTVTLKLIQPNGTITDFPLKDGAQIDLFGRQGDGKGESNNGIQVLLTSTSSDCGSSPNSTDLFLSIKPEAQSSSGFYMNRNNVQDEDNAYIERFQDTSCQSVGPGTDPDSCERLKRIYIHYAQTSKPKEGGLKVGCHNGECVLKFIYKP